MEVTPVICEMCDDGPVSSHRCEDCSQNMCRTCTGHHQKMKLTKDHKITQLGKREQPENLCTETDDSKEKRDKQVFLCDNGKHANLELTYYCFTCDVAVCSVCREKEHNNHNSSEIDEAAAAKRNALNQLIKKLEDNDPEKVIQACRCQNQSVEQTRDTLVENVETQFGCFQHKISGRKNELVEQIKMLSEKTVKNLKTVVEQSEKAQSEYETVLTDAKRLADETPLNIRFLQEFGRVFRSLNKLKKNLPQAPVVQLTYNQACTSDDFGKVVAALGTVTEDNGVDPRASVSDGSDHVSLSTLSSSEFHRITNDCTDLAVALSSLLDSIRSSTPQQTAVSRDPGLRESVFVAEQCQKLNMLQTNSVTTAAGSTGFVNQPDNDQTVHSPRSRAPQNLRDRFTCSFRKTCIPEAMRQAVMSEDIYKVVKSRFRSRKIDGYWIIEGTDVVMNSKTELMANQCMHCLLQTVCRKNIQIPEGCVDVMDSDKWEGLVKELRNEYQDKVWLTPSRKTNVIIVCSTCSAILDDVSDTLHAFLRDNQLRTILMTYQNAVVKKIMRHKKKLKNIQASFSQYRIVIEKKSDDVILIKGVGYGLAKAVHLVHELAAKIHGIDGGEERFSDSEGSDRFSEDEEIAVKVDPGVGLSMCIGDKEVLLHAMCFPGDDCVIYVVSGDITNLPVEVIASPSNSKLKHDGGLSKALVTSGGWSIQAECYDHIKVHGNLEAGEIFCSGAGTLPLKAIIHTVSAKWALGAQVAKEKLSRVVYSALDTATRFITQSLAFPAIGAGAYGIPVEESTSTITDSLARFLTSHPHTGLREIYLCDMATDTASMFVSALVKKYAKPDIVLCSPTSKINRVMPVAPKDRDTGQMLFLNLPL